MPVFAFARRSRAVIPVDELFFCGKCLAMRNLCHAITYSMFYLIYFYYYTPFKGSLPHTLTTPSIKDSDTLTLELL